MSVIYKVIQRRSSVGLPEEAAKTLLSLGLGEFQKTVFIESSASTTAKLAKIVEAVHVKIVSKEVALQDVKYSGKKNGFLLQKTTQRNRVTSSLFSSTFAICVLLVGANSLVPCPVDGVHGNDSIIDERLKKQQEKVNQERSI
ncbi:uncharacterized protein RJT21DRAFT_5444 [Scheffersomyces amazonensis]|uniref:uncharacterized protein n=1 Tax=Scheffersomyces amazonensis TaxID=1078765 RepID=UPI00315D8806